MLRNVLKHVRLIQNVESLKYKYTARELDCAVGFYKKKLGKGLYYV
jgi:hypothetical protein